jgi:uncharacterized membrane protein YphA (DoxX/SURF4 family)
MPPLAVILGSNAFAERSVEVAACVIALVLVWSAIAKVFDTSGTAEAIVAFGLPLARPMALATLLILMEVTTGFCLVISLGTGPGGVQLSAYAAALLFASFSVLLGRSLVRGDDFACHCFGGGSHPISFRTFARACALTLLAVIVAVRPPVATMPISQMFAALVLAASGLGMSTTLLSVARMFHFNTHLRQMGIRQ